MFQRSSLQCGFGACGGGRSTLCGSSRSRMHLEQALGWLMFWSCNQPASEPLVWHLEPMPLLARVVAVLNSMELAGSSRCSRREGQERPAGHTTSGCGGSRSTWSRCLAFAAVASYLLRNMGQWRPRCCERVTRGASSRIEWNILEYTTIYLNI